MPIEVVKPGCRRPSRTRARGLLPRRRAAVGCAGPVLADRRNLLVGNDRGAAALSRLHGSSSGSASPGRSAAQSPERRNKNMRSNLSHPTPSHLAPDL